MMLRTVAVVALALLAGCHGGITITGQPTSVKADDGFDLVAVRFTEKTAWPRGEPRAIVFYVQGSEDRSVTEAAGRVAGFCVMNAPVVGVERRGVYPNGKVDAATACRFATRERRIADVLTVMDATVKAERPDVPVLLMGASEGGDIAAAAAARSVPGRVDAMILLGSGGGWTQEEEFRQFIRARGSYLGMSSESELDAKLAEIRAEPNSDKEWLGHPYRRWSTYMFVRSADDLVKVDAPILLVQGSADQSVPVESARALRDAFAAAGKTNLTYVEIAGADHSFKNVETGVSQLPRVELAVIEFLAKQGVVSAGEASANSERVRRNHPELFGAGEAK